MTIFGKGEFFPWCGDGSRLAGPPDWPQSLVEEKGFLCPVGVNPPHGHPAGRGSPLGPGEVARVHRPFQLSPSSSLPEPSMCWCLRPSVEPRLLEKVREKREFGSGSGSSLTSRRRSSGGGLAGGEGEQRTGWAVPITNFPLTG